MSYSEDWRDYMFTPLFWGDFSLKESYPPTDVIQDEKIGANGETRYRVDVAVAGFQKDQLNVEINEGKLIVSSVLPDEDPFILGDIYHYRGIAKRKFKRVFKLNPDAEVTKVEIENGILSVYIMVNVPIEKQPKIFEITEK